MKFEKNVHSKNCQRHFHNMDMDNGRGLIVHKYNSIKKSVNLYNHVCYLHSKDVNNEILTEKSRYVYSILK